MKIAIAAAVSVDGKLTRHGEDNIYDWISAEDQVHFRKLISEHDAILMGRGTYEAVKDRLQLNKEKLRVVLTSQPERFVDNVVAGQLEFFNQEPGLLVKNLSARNIKSLLIVGGPKIITDFLQAKLVDNIYLTIEPRLFGQGNPLLEDKPLDMGLILTETIKLNRSGTILLNYRIQK